MNNARKGIGVAAAVLCFAAGAAHGESPLLVVYPEGWHEAVTNFSAFKQRLGYDVRQTNLWDATGGQTNDPAALRSTLLAYYSSLAVTQQPGYVLLVGDFQVVPAPLFQVDAGDTPYYSDIYYSIPDREFDGNGNGTNAEYGAAGDVTPAQFDAFFTTLSNLLVVGRIPVPGTAGVETVRQLLDALMTFERETGGRKGQALLTAGRIDTNATPADSWQYVVRDLAGQLGSNYPARVFVTVSHVASNYADRTGIDYAVEGDSLSAGYTAGQNLVRGLWESNDACAFLCNVSHGGSFYDFALRRNGLGFPTNVHAAIVLSLSCASYTLGAAALTAGVAAAYLGSTAVVTPDVLTLLSASQMVSAEVQQRATLKIYGMTQTVGRVFREEFDYYVDRIPVTGWLTYQLYKPEILRNVVGFQIIGDPTLRLEHPDGDGDGLLDPEEAAVGTLPGDADTDGDGLPDGYEFYTETLDPLTDNGPDVDGDGALNGDEWIAGTDPLAGASFPWIGWNGAAEGMVLYWDSVTGRLYTVQQATNATPFDWQDGSSVSTGTGAHIEFQPDTAPEAAFFRLTISRP
ncbi:MAG: hypothetical protein KJ726_09200 [Verrucomicrobia bacterium]|nr:hypothetical protein [Verrucomicrobiota bacterium]